MAHSAMTQDTQHKNKKSPNRNFEPTTMRQNELQTDKNMEFYYAYLRNKDTRLHSKMPCKMSVSFPTKRNNNTQVFCNPCAEI